MARSQGLAGFSSVYYIQSAYPFEFSETKAGVSFHSLRILTIRNVLSNERFHLGVFLAFIPS